MMKAKILKIGLANNDEKAIRKEEEMLKEFLKSYTKEIVSMNKTYIIKDNYKILGKVTFMASARVLPKNRFINKQEYQDFLLSRFEDSVDVARIHINNTYDRKVVHLAFMYNLAIRIKYYVWANLGEEESKKLKLIKSDNSFVLEYKGRSADLSIAECVDDWRAEDKVFKSLKIKD